MSNLSSKLKVDNELLEKVIGVDIKHNYWGLEMKKSRLRMTLCSEILQYVLHSNNVEDIFKTIATKLLNLLHPVHICIYKIDNSENTNKDISISGRVVAEAIASACKSSLYFHLENILREEYEWAKDVTRTFHDSDKGNLNKYAEINLAKKFTGKAYLLVPIGLLEGEPSLWGFLIVYQCSTLDSHTCESSWDQDDVLMLQQIAIQIEIVLHRDNLNGEVSRLYGTVQDISDRKAAEEKLLQSNTLLSLTIENAPIGLATFNLSGKFLTVNPCFCKLFGYSAEELLDMTAIDITHPESVKDTLKALNQLIINEVNSIQIRKQYLHKDGHEIAAISHVGLMKDSDDKPIQFIVGIEDVSDRKAVDAKFAAAKLTEAANQAKSEFLAVMSHELRTPMNAVIGTTGLLLDTLLSPQQQQYVSIIRQGGEMLLSVINDILDFSRIESGRFELEEHSFYLQQCIEEVLDLMTSRTADKSLELLALIDLDVPHQIMGDHTRLRQILVNLVSNAIKFTESGEIVITVKSKLIDLETNSYELLFNVRDTGIGIEPEGIARLFKAFSQANNSISRKYGGTGLGLAICKQLCELMGGEIGVKSTVGKGSTFSFSIRATAIASEPIAIVPEVKGKRILSVNSHPTSQQAIALYTQQWQVSTQMACSATETLQLLKLFPFDAVLIDRQLEDIDGIELARSIQESFPNLNLVLVTYLTAIANPLPVSFAACIPKPISVSKIYQVLTNIFSLKDSTSSTSNLIPNSSVSSNSVSPILDEKFAIDHPLQILVVEDNPVNKQILLLMLEKLGYKSKAVENGLEAVNALKQQAYDIIFMDIQMPIMDGLTATQNIRELSYRHPWIIGLSANAFMDSRESALSAGMNDYLTKPLQFEVLIAALRRVPQLIISEFGQHTLNLATLSTLEDSIGKQDLSKLIIVYLEHSSQTISRMKEAFEKRDLVTLEAENHSLKGGSGTFGATQLFEFCQDLQFICKILIKSNRHTSEDIEKIESILKNIEAEYNHVAQAFQSYENTEHCIG